MSSRSIFNNSYQKNSIIIRLYSTIDRYSFTSSINSTIRIHCNVLWSHFHKLHTSQFLNIKIPSWIEGIIFISFILEKPCIWNTLYLNLVAWKWLYCYWLLSDFITTAMWFSLVIRLCGLYYFKWLADVNHLQTIPSQLLIFIPEPSSL